MPNNFECPTISNAQIYKKKLNEPTKIWIFEDTAGSNSILDGSSNYVYEKYNVVHCDPLTIYMEHIAMRAVH